LLTEALPFRPRDEQALVVKWLNRELHELRCELFHTFATILFRHVDGWIALLRCTPCASHGITRSQRYDFAAAAYVSESKRASRRSSEKAFPRDRRAALCLVGAEHPRVSRKRECAGHSLSLSAGRLAATHAPVATHQRGRYASTAANSPSLESPFVVIARLDRAIQ
jgi:hypothetical protein